MKRWILSSLLGLILFSIPTIANARARWTGIASKGGQSLVTAGQSSTSKGIIVYPGCTVTIKLAGTNTNATIYGDNSGTPKTNPFTAGSDASIFFYVDNGRYDVQLSGTGVASPFIAYGDVQIYDKAIDYASTSNMGGVKLDVAPVSSTNPIAAGANSPLVLNNFKVFNIVNYGAVSDSSDDTTAINAAISAATSAGGGIVFFPSGTWRTTGFILPSKVFLLGNNTAQSSGCQLLLTQNSGAAIEIGENTQEIGISGLDIKPLGGVTGTTKGIYAHGSYPNSSQVADISHNTIENFTYGIYISAEDITKNWQFSYVKYDDNTFSSNNRGIYFDAKNTEALISHNKFYMAAGGYGLYIDNSAAITIEQSWGLGPPGVTICTSPPAYDATLAEAFVYINGQHSNIIVSNSLSEGVKYSIVNNFSDYTYPLTITGSFLPDVRLNQAIEVKSSGNTWYKDSVIGTMNAIVNTDTDHIVANNKCNQNREFTNGVSNSTTTVTTATGTFNSGDVGLPIWIADAGTNRFYTTIASVTNATTLVLSTAVPFTASSLTLTIGDGFVMSGGSYVVSKIDKNGANYKFPLWIGSVEPDVRSFTTVADPMFAVGNSTVARVLARFGAVDSVGRWTNYYDIARDSNGYLTFTGNQTIPNKGYKFNAPIILTGTSSVAVSPSGYATINWNDTAKLLQASMDGAAFVNIVTASTTLTANSYLIGGGGALTQVGILSQPSGTKISLAGATSQLESNATAGTAPLLLTGGSETKVTHFNSDLLDGYDWTAPPTIGSTTPGIINGTKGTYTQALNSGVVALSDGATISTDASLGNTFTVTLGGNRTLATPTNLTNGQELWFVFTQDGTGNRTISYSAGYIFGSTLLGCTLSTAANKVDVVMGKYNSTLGKVLVLQCLKGYN